VVQTPDPPTSQTDRLTDDMQSQDRALHSASCGKNEININCSTVWWVPRLWILNFPVKQTLSSPVHVIVGVLSMSSGSSQLPPGADVQL